MRRVVLVAVVVLSLSAPAFAREESSGRTLVAANIAGPFFGLYAFTIERIIAPDLGVVVAPVYYNLRYSMFRPLAPLAVVAWYTGLRGGIHYYPGHSAPGGLFAGVYLQAGMMLLSDGVRTGSGAFAVPAWTIGYRFFMGRFGIAPRIRIGCALPFFEHDDVVIGNELLYAPTSLNWDFAMGISFVF